MASQNAPTRVSVESELMKNQKHAEVMAPDRNFEVLQTAQGDSLFFSLGSDGIFYVTREVQGSQTGWNKIDLSTALNGKAKLFMVSQDPASLTIDVALVISNNSGDLLYLSMGNDTNTNTWQSIQWTAVPHDGITEALAISDVYFLTSSSPTGSTRCCFVDIEQDPNKPHHVLDRYYIQFGPQLRWIQHKLPIQLTAGTISSCLGRRKGEDIPGIYTFGAIDDTMELIYAPQYEEFNPSLPPRPSRLLLPAGASSIASAFNSKAESNLFVAGSDGLWLFPPNSQLDQAKPILAVPSPLIGKYNVFSGLKSLSAFTTSARTAVWGINTQGDLVYTSCATGKELISSEWTFPVPICPKIEGYAFYLNVATSNNVLFAHTSGDNLTQLTQDPVTSLWSGRKILLPPTNVNDILEFNTFTTHIKVSDDYNVGVAKETLSITSTSPVPVFINGIYYLLTPTVPVQVTTDSLGTLNIIQETQSLSAVGYQVTNDALGPITVDPMAGPMDKLAKVQSGSNLDVKVRLDSGVEKPLVPDDVSSKAKDSAAKCFQNLVQIKTSMGKPAVNGARRVATPTKSFGMSFANGLFYEADEAHHMLGIPNQKQALAGIGSVDISIGDLVTMVDGWIDDVDSFVVQQLDNAWHFCAKIYDKVYTAIMDTVDSVVGAIEFVFNQIKIFIEEIIAFLGFLFNWKDILRTHSVIKNILTQYTHYGISQVDNLKTTVDNGLAAAQSEIDSWAGMSKHDQVIFPPNQQTPAGADTPQANWAMSHIKNGIGNSTVNMPSTKLLRVTQANDGLDQALAALEEPVKESIEVISEAAKRIKEEIADNIKSITPDTLFKKLAAILADAILQEAGVIVSATLGVIKFLAEAAFDQLGASVDIPIISWIYNKITGEDLSILDLICLIAAVPTTLIYKVTMGAAPFPANDHTDALIHASDFSTLNRLLFQPQQEARKARPSKTVSSLAAADPGAVGLTIVFNILGGIGSGIVAWMLAVDFGSESADPEGGEGGDGLKEEPDPLIAFVTAGGALLYLFPSYPSMASLDSTGSAKDYEKLNGALTLIDTLKVFVDGGFAAGLVTRKEISTRWNLVSPPVETLLNLIWLVPAGMGWGDSEKKPSDKASLAASVFFDVGGALTLTYKVAKGDLKAVIFAVAELCTVGCGVSDFAYTVELIKGN